MLSTCSLVGADITRQRCSGTTQAGYSGLVAWFFSGLPAIPSLVAPVARQWAVRRAWGQPKPPQHLNLARRDSAKSHKPSRSLPFYLPTRTRIQDAVRCQAPRIACQNCFSAEAGKTRTGSGVCFSSKPLFIPFTLAKTRHSIPPAGRLCRLVTHGRLQRSCLSCIDIGEGGRVTRDCGRSAQSRVYASLPPIISLFIQTSSTCADWLPLSRAFHTQHILSTISPSFSRSYSNGYYHDGAARPVREL